MWQVQNSNGEAKGTSGVGWNVMDSTGNIKDANSGGAGSSTDITQSSHGFVAGDVLYLNGSTYTKAIASSAAAAEVVGIVSAVADTNTFTLLFNGDVTGLTGLTAGTVYFLSDSVAGALTSVEPTTTNYVSKPLLIAASTTEGYFFNMRGKIVDGSGYSSMDEDGVVYAVSQAVADSGTIQWDHDAEGSGRLVANLNPITPEQTTYGFYSAGKNALFNGAMDVWQRGTSFVSPANAAYVADRWTNVNSTDGLVTISRDTDVPTMAQAGVLFNYSMKFDVTTADATIGAAQNFGIQQKVEGYTWRGFAQRNLTFSFWIKSTKTGTYTAALRNSGADRSLVIEFTVDVANTWEKKIIDFTASPSAGTWNYTNGIGVYCSIMFCVGSTGQTTAGSWQTGNFLGTSSNSNTAFDNTANNIFVTGCQLEVGDTATDFEHVPFVMELQRCMRYFEKSYSYATTPGTATNTGGLQWWPHIILTDGNSFRTPMTFFRVTKQAAPTITIYSTATGTAGNVYNENYDGATDTDRGATVSFTGENSFSIASSGGVGASTVIANAAANISWQWAAAAEI